MMKRRQDWPERLAEQLQAAASRPFEWGSFDCGLAAADAIQAMTGEDPAAELRGQYSTSAGAKKSLRAFAGGGLEQVAEKIAGVNKWREIPVGRAQRGDLVLFDGPLGTTLGVVGMHGTHAHSVGLKGVARVPVLSCRRAWRV